MSENQVLSQQKISNGNRTYYFDLKLSAKGKKYLSLNEVKTDEAGEKKYSRIMFFEDDFKRLSLVFNTLMSEAGLKEIYSLESLREKYPNAYTPWEKDDDLKLEKLYLKGKSVEELSRYFKRQPGAIEARLSKLELLETVSIK